MRFVFNPACFFLTVSYIIPAYLCVCIFYFIKYFITSCFVLWQFQRIFAILGDLNALFYVSANLHSSWLAFCVWSYLIMNVLLELSVGGLSIFTGNVSSKEDLLLLLTAARGTADLRPFQTPLKVLAPRGSQIVASLKTGRDLPQGSGPSCMWPSHLPSRLLPTA